MDIREFRNCPEEASVFRRRSSSLDSKRISVDVGALAPGWMVTQEIEIVMSGMNMSWRAPWYASHQTGHEAEA